jgi:hypothetical protein
LEVSRVVLGPGLGLDNGDQEDWRGERDWGVVFDEGGMVTECWETQAIEDVVGTGVCPGLCVCVRER